MISDQLEPVDPRPLADARLRGRRLLFARRAWLAATLLTLGLFVASLAPYYRDLITFRIGQINSPALIQAGLGQLGLSSGAYAAYILTARVVFAIVHVAVALLIFARRSDDRVALLFSFTLQPAQVSLWLRETPGDPRERGLKLAPQNSPES